LAEAEAKITELNTKLLRQSEQFKEEKQELNIKLEAEAQQNSDLRKLLSGLQEKCLEFSNRCIQRLRKFFHSVGASSAKFSPSAEDLSKTFEHIEGEIHELDEVIAGHGDFCAWVASLGTAAAFLKAGCDHGKIVNRPNFTLSPSILDDIPDLARSISNRFVKMIWTKGGREKAGDEARSHLEPVRSHTLCLPLSSSSILTYNNLIHVG
jgi:archaellum component FlaC